MDENIQIYNYYKQTKKEYIKATNIQKYMYKNIYLKL